VEETKDVVVVDKPGTLPVHACGGYHVQSLMNLLEAQKEQFGKLYTIHRLDRLTSGLVILGKTSAVAQEWGKSIMNRNCQKSYLARVAGKFPLHCSAKELPRILVDPSNLPNNGEWVVETETHQPATAARKQNAHGYWIADENGKVQKEADLQSVFDCQRSEDEWLLEATNAKEEEANPSTRGLLWFHLACPNRVAQPKDGICEAGAFETLDDELYLKTVKPAQTSFGVVRYDEATDSTVVLCRPATGRTHQIRLHLQYLGHSIANDLNYGGDIWYGNPDGQKASKMAQERLDAINTANQSDMDLTSQGKDAPPSSSPAVVASTSTVRIDLPATEEEIQKDVSAAVREKAESIHEFIQRTCVWCARCRIGGTDRTALEFLIRSPGIWLHALLYSFIGLDGRRMSYRAPLPKWHKFENSDDSKK
jgi:23S rRNA-/tRNA-specific pseudouridylate synthase